VVSVHDRWPEHRRAPIVLRADDRRAVTNLASVRFSSGEGRRLNGRARSVPFLLVRPEEFGLRQDLPLHGLFELRLAWPAEVGKDSVESEELVEVAVAPNRRARPAIARPLPVVQSLACAGGQRVPLHSLGQLAGGRQEIVERPVHQVIFGALGSGASGSSMISATLLVPLGGSDQASGGETSWPSQV